MSYNIDTWHTKELVDFTIPLSVIHTDNNLRVILTENNGVEVDGYYPEAFELKGQLVHGSVIVSKLYFGGEGSGHAWENFKEILSQSSGKLISSQVWEGGESITRLIVIEGKITEEEIEI